MSLFNVKSEPVKSLKYLELTKSLSISIPSSVLRSLKKHDPAMRKIHLVLVIYLKKKRETGQSKTDPSQSSVPATNSSISIT